MQERVKYRALASFLRRGILAGSWVPGERLPTQDDLAAEHGLSVTSVRRAIDELVDERLVERVQGSGTFVLPIPRPPRRHGGLVGALVPDVQLYYPRILAGLTSALEPYGVRVHAVTYEYDAGRQDAALMDLLGAGVDAIVLTPTLPWPGLPAGAPPDLPLVLLERRVRQDSLRDRRNHVCSDHRAGAVDAVDHLVALGHRRIGLLSRDHPVTAPDVRIGYERATADHGLEPHIWNAPMEAWRDHAEDALSEVIDRGVTAVLVMGDREAIIIQQAALRRGLRVPEDLAMVSYDDEMATSAPVPLTSVSPPKFRLGRAAGHMIWDQLREGPLAPVQHVTVRPSLVLRESCGHVGAGGRPVLPDVDLP